MDLERFGEVSPSESIIALSKEPRVLPARSRVGLAHCDMHRYCNVTRNPQVAYLSRRNHFHVKNGQNGFGKRSFLMFQAIIAHEMTGFPWKCLTVTFPW